MTGIEIALLSGLGGSILKGAAGAYGNMLTKEQKKRMKELERMEAEDAFGLSDQQRQGYETQVMSPVQTAEREALARFGASQSVGDIGQGAAFRQQQAIKQASEAARAEAQRAVVERDAEMARLQQQQLERMRQQERQVIMSLLGAAGEGVQQAGGTLAKMKFAEEQYALNKPSAEDEAVIGNTLDVLGLNTQTPGYKNVEGVSMSGKTDNALGLDSVGTVEGMMDQNTLNERIDNIKLDPEQFKKFREGLSDPEKRLFDSNPLGFIERYLGGVLNDFLIGYDETGITGGFDNVFNK